jgi:hypothetical protein
MCASDDRSRTGVVTLGELAVVVDSFERRFAGFAVLAFALTFFFVVFFFVVGFVVFVVFWVVGVVVGSAGVCLVDVTGWATAVAPNVHATARMRTQRGTTQ